MSNRTNLKLWRVVEPKLRELNEEDRATQQHWIDFRKEDKKRDTKLLLDIFVPLFLQYCGIVRDLGKIVDDMVQVQVRAYIKRIYDMACARLCELKDYLCLIELSQFIYLDNAMIERRLIPYDVQFLTPEHLKRYNREPEIQELLDKMMRERMSEHAKRKMEDETASENISIKTFEIEEEIIKFSLEDGEESMEEETEEETVEEISKFSPSELEKYATTIQRFWRGYYVRKLLKDEEIKRQIIMGMLPKSEGSDQLHKRLDEAKLQKQQLRNEYMKQLKQFAEEEETYIFAARTPQTLEDISDEIIEWMSEWYARTNCFDSFPATVDGGTILIVTGQTKFIEEYLNEQEEAQRKAELYAKDPGAKQKEQEEAKKRKAAEKAKRKALKRKLKAEARARRVDVFPIFNFEITPCLEEMKSKLNDYRNVWGNLSLEDNPAQENYEEFVIEDIYAKLNKQLRPQVEKMLKVEYDLLVVALNKDRKKQRLKPFRPTRRAQKKKRKRGRKKKDLIGERKTEDLFQELFDNGIIRPYPEVSLDDFISDWNYAGYEYRQAYRIPIPELRDIVASIRTDCILSLGSRNVTRPKGVLIAGPPKSGKKLLINAVLNETGAVLFDLSREILTGKYTGRKNTRILVQMVIKIAQLLQPSVLFVNGAERMLGPVIKTIAKQIQTEDMIMFISSSKQPWAGGKTRQLLKIYQKVIMLPRLGYSSCLEFWKRELLQTHQISLIDFDFSSLAKKTVNYNIPYLRECLQTALIKNRKQLEPDDIYCEVIVGGQAPMAEKGYEPYVRFMARTPWGRKNAKRQAEIQANLERERKAAEAEAKKKKQRK